jgi:hypothetical protein
MGSNLRCRIAREEIFGPVSLGDAFRYSDGGNKNCPHHLASPRPVWARDVSRSNRSVRSTPFSKTNNEAD